MLCDTSVGATCAAHTLEPGVDAYMMRGCVFEEAEIGLLSLTGLIEEIVYFIS